MNDYSLLIVVLYVVSIVITVYTMVAEIKSDFIIRFFFITSLLIGLPVFANLLSLTRMPDIIAIILTIPSHFLCFSLITFLLQPKETILMIKELTGRDERSIRIKKEIQNSQEFDNFDESKHDYSKFGIKRKKRN